jgi:hypothetical protein
MKKSLLIPPHQIKSNIINGPALVDSHNIHRFQIKRDPTRDIKQKYPLFIVLFKFPAFVPPNKPKNNNNNQKCFSC